MSSPVLMLRSRRYRGAASFDLVTSDGVHIAGSRVGTEGPSIALCHGFLGWHRKTRIVRLTEELARHAVVYAFDLRGHGLSGGESTMGALEVLDVDAVVAHARRERPEEPVATIGMSMGGVAVMRHAAELGGIDAVVSISAPARYVGHTSRGVQQIRWLQGSPRGRRTARALGVRLAPEIPTPPPPEDIVGGIAPIPLIVVHGRDDHIFDEEEAWRLYRRAGEPKRLLLARRFGHAEDGLTPRFSELLVHRVLADLGHGPHADARPRVEHV